MGIVDGFSPAVSYQRPICNYKIIDIGPRRLAGDVRLSQLPARYLPDPGLGQLRAAGTDGYLHIFSWRLFFLWISANFSMGQWTILWYMP